MLEAFEFLGAFDLCGLMILFRGSDMKTVGFPISDKENEKRRALLPEHASMISHPEMLVFERGYGQVAGYSDQQYLDLGARVGSKEEVLSQDVICDPKIGDAKYLHDLDEGKTIFGWVHAVQSREITDVLLEKSLTAYAWEEMYESGRHVFWRNNELAGEAAVMHAFQCFGMMPYETKVAVIGRGNTARGAIKILNMLGAEVFQYDRRTERLFVAEIGRYDVVVNCVLWDVSRTDHIIGREDLCRMKKGSMIIDVSCDRNGGVETSIPTTINDPVYYVDGVLHYVVDHTPALFHKTFSRNNSELLHPYIEMLIQGEDDPVLRNAKIVEKGVILDEKIMEHQNRTLLFM